MKKVTTKSPQKRRTKRQMIVFIDGEKNYYALSRATLERSRIDKRQNKKVAKALKDKACEFRYINRACIPGSTVATPLEGGRQLHYAGYYVSSTEPK